MIYLIVGSTVFVGFCAHLLRFSAVSRHDDLRCPESSDYQTRYRTARKIAGVVVIRRD